MRIRATLPQDRALNTDGSNVVEILAPTGAAAVNVNGKTMHSFLKIPMGNFFRSQCRGLAGFPN